MHCTDEAWMTTIRKTEVGTCALSIKLTWQMSAVAFPQRSSLQWTFWQSWGPGCPWSSQCAQPVTSHAVSQQWKNSWPCTCSKKYIYIYKKKKKSKNMDSNSLEDLIPHHDLDFEVSNPNVMGNTLGHADAQHTTFGYKSFSGPEEMQLPSPPPFFWDTLRSILYTISMKTFCVALPYIIMHSHVTLFGCKGFDSGSEDPNTKRFKWTLVYFNMDTQYAHFWGNPLYQASKQHSNNR